MSETIPPSIVLITIGSVTGRVDHGAVHRRPAAGAGAAWCWWLVSSGFRRAQRRHERRRAAGAAPEIAKLLADRAARASRLPFVIRTAVVEGVATATEVSTIGIVYTRSCGLFIYRQFDWRAHLSDAGRYRVAVGRDPDHHRLRHRRWPGRSRSRASRRICVKSMTAVPGGKWGFLAISVAGLRDPRQRAGRHPGDRAVRPAAVPGRQDGGRARGALRDGRHLRDGPRACSRRRSAWASTRRARSAACRRTSPSAACGPTSRRCSSRC